MAVRALFGHSFDTDEGVSQATDIHLGRSVWLGESVGSGRVQVTFVLEIRRRCRRRARCKGSVALRRSVRGFQLSPPLLRAESNDNARGIDAPIA